MTTIFLVIGACIGLGLLLGIILGTIRAIPTLIWGVVQVFIGAVEGAREGIHEGNQRADRILAKHTSLPPEPERPPFLQELKEAWNQGWADVRAKKQQQN